MTIKAWFGWTFLWPISMWAERRFKRHGDGERNHGDGTLYGYLESRAWWVRLGRWADQTAHILAEVSLGNDWP